MYWCFCLVYRLNWAVPLALVLQSCHSSCLHLSPSSIHSSTPPPIHPLISPSSPLTSPSLPLSSQSAINHLEPQWQLNSLNTNWVIHFSTPLITVGSKQTCISADTFYSTYSHTELHRTLRSKHTNTHKYTHNLLSCIRRAGSNSVRAFSLIISSTTSLWILYAVFPLAVSHSPHCSSYKPTRICTHTHTHTHTHTPCIHMCLHPSTVGMFDLCGYRLVCFYGWGKVLGEGWMHRVAGGASLGR